MADFSSLIRAWFRQKGRDLPWRNTSDPYKIWLSEIILQQTRVDQGISYYHKFVQHFPSIKDLALANEDEVLNLWQGLGYYSRARNLHAAAQIIHETYNDQFPTAYQKIRELKGVGDYTAAAIASFAYDLPHAVVDGNVFRVLSRYLEIETPIDTSQGKKDFYTVANELLDVSNPASHNQAIMELGALVCTPKNPSCENCPVTDTCQARANETQLNFPIKSKRTKVSKRYINYLVCIDNDITWIKKRTGKGIWQGLYDFPAIELNTDRNLTKKDLTAYRFSDYHLDGNFKHILSHQIIHAKFWIVNVNNKPSDASLEKINLNQLEDYPLPQLLIRYIEQSSLFGAD